MNPKTKLRRCDYCGTLTAPRWITVEGARFRARCCADPECVSDATSDLRMQLQDDACHYDAFGY